MDRTKITYEDIQKANETIKTTDIKGKDYAEVNQRIKAFRMVYPNGTIETEMVSNENGVCIFKASIYDEDDHLLSNGTAYEKENSSFINRTSYIENCETSAIGRALGIAGFGIDTSIASAEEVKNAIVNQEVKQAKPSSNKENTEVNYKTKLLEKLKELGIDANEYAKAHKLNSKTTQEEAKALLDELENGVVA